jgi:hypothetical protein
VAKRGCKDEKDARDSIVMAMLVLFGCFAAQDRVERIEFASNAVLSAFPNTVKQDTNNNKPDAAQKPKNADEGQMYAACGQILQEKNRAIRHLACSTYSGSADSDTLFNKSGVAFGALLDFDDDGAEELFICYNSTEMKTLPYSDLSSRCVYEVWGYDGKLKLIAEEWVPAFGGRSSLSATPWRPASFLFCRRKDREHPCMQGYAYSGSEKHARLRLGEETQENKSPVPRIRKKHHKLLGQCISGYS